MASQRTSSTKRSTSRKTTVKHPKEGAGRGNRAPRAHRGDTPEAKMQRARSPKTHPTGGRTPGAQRKD